MRNLLLATLGLIICLSLTSCNGSQPATEDQKEKSKTTEPIEKEMKTGKVTVLIEEEMTVSLKVDSKSFLASQDGETGILVFGNLKSPSNLVLKSSEVMMTTIAMQESRTPAPVVYPASAEGKAAVIQSGLFQGSLYEASVLCVCDRALDDALMADLKSGKVYLDDICKKLK